MLNNYSVPHRQHGFTFVELIIVIILISVLAVSAYSRFSGSTGYAEYTYQSRLISILRNMQTRAMFDTRTAEPTNGAYCFQVNLLSSPPTFGPPTLAHHKVDNLLNRSATCGLTIDRTNNPEYLFTTSTEMTNENVNLSAVNSNDEVINFIQFDNLGRPSTNQSAACGIKCKITLTGESPVAVCVNAEGYIYACD